MDYLILGSGVAGISAVKELLKYRQPEDSITVLSEESYPFYYRPRLIECISGEVAIEDIIINDRQWFDNNKIDLHLQERANSIDCQQQSVITEQGVYNYDKLLLAHGAHSFVPPIDGIDDERVFTLRHAEDALEIYRKARQVDKAVVMGCGLLGLEISYNLMKAGVEATSLEVEDHLLPRQLDHQAGKYLQQKLEDMGLKFSLSAKTTSLVASGDKLLVRLADGRELEAGMVLLSTGVRSNTELLAETPIHINRAVTVNSRQETNVPGVYAAGDVAEVDGEFYGIWPPAMQQGRVAGRNMAGQQEEFSGFVPSYKLKVVDIDVVSLGQLEAEAGDVVEVDQGQDYYRKVIKNSDGKAVGAILIGEVEDKQDIINSVKSS
ncbi:MAG: NAD(P)/FAD-dependent oxidoreductase [Bacillota bacterium]